MSEGGVGHGLVVHPQVGKVFQITAVKLLASQICQECFLPGTRTSLLLQQILDKSVRQLIMIKFKNIVGLLACVPMNSGYNSIVKNMLPNGLQLVDCHIFQI